MITWDNRWQGNFGIARFAREVRKRIRLNVTDLNDGPPPGSPGDAFYLRSRLSRARPTLHVTPAFNGALGQPVRQLLTLHDLIHLEVPAEASLAKSAYYTAIVKPAIRRTGMVLTGSEFSKTRIMDWSGLRADQVRVLSYGISHAFTGSGKCAVRDSSSPQVMFVGNGKPHKNFDLLVRSLRHFEKSQRPALLVVGLSDNEVGASLNKYGLSSVRFRTLRDVSDEHLAEHYRASDALAFPSLYEGFGLMAAEAMACGTPTAYLCEAVGEVMGGYGARAADSSAESFAAAVSEAIELKSACREGLLERAATFSWSTSAQRLESAIVEC